MLSIFKQKNGHVTPSEATRIKRNFSRRRDSNQTCTFCKNLGRRWKVKGAQHPDLTENQTMRALEALRPSTLCPGFYHILKDIHALLPEIPRKHQERKIVFIWFFGVLAVGSVMHRRLFCCLPALDRILLKIQMTTFVILEFFRYLRTLLKFKHAARLPFYLLPLASFREKTIFFPFLIALGCCLILVAPACHAVLIFKKSKTPPFEEIFNQVLK